MLKLSIYVPTSSQSPSSKSMHFIPGYSILTLLFIAGTFLTLGDLSMKQWIKTSGGNFLTHPLIYTIGMIFYVIGLTLYAFSLKQENIAVATIIVIFFNILTVLFIGRYFFGETFTLFHYVGMFFGLLAIIAFELAVKS